MKILRILVFVISLFFLVHTLSFAANYTISGRAIDTLSNLVINARISVVDLHTKKEVAKTTTGLDGYYVITVPQGAYNITLLPQSQSGLAPITANNLVITSNTQHNFTLPIPNPTSTENSGKIQSTTPGAVAPSGTFISGAPTGVFQSAASRPMNPTLFIIIGVVVLILLIGGGVWFWHYRQTHQSLYYNPKG